MELCRLIADSFHGKKILAQNIGARKLHIETFARNSKSSSIYRIIATATYL